MSTTEIRTTKKRSVVAPSNMMVTKTPVSSIRMSMGGGYGPGNVIERSVRRTTYAGPPTLKPGVAGQVTKEGVTTVIQNRDREKAEMDHLNTKLCDYIEDGHFLRANCDALTAEIERLKKSKGLEQARVADLYKTEIEELRNNNKTLEETINPLRSQLIAKEDEVEVLTERFKDAEEEIKKLHDKLRQYGDENGDLEGQCKQLKNEIDRLNDRINYLEGQNELLQGDNRRFMKDCDEAITKQLLAEERVKDLEEELQFLDQTTEEEILELREQLKQKQNPVDVQAMWKKNFGNAVSTMQQHYRDELNRISDEVRRQSDERLRVMQMGMNKENRDGAILKSDNHTLKTQLGDKKKSIMDLEAQNKALQERLRLMKQEFDEAQEECEKEKSDLHGQVAELQRQIEDVMNELKDLHDDRLSLEMQIATYRKLLEGEESRSLKKFVEDQQKMQSRGGADLAQIITGGGGGGGSSMQSS